MFTQKQTKIINNEVYPSYLEASAGMGKTEVIIAKVVHLIEAKRIDLSRIAAITFTNKATNEMVARLNERLYEAWQSGRCKDEFLRRQIDTVHMARISTIHAFCGEIIRRYGFEINISPEFSISNLKYQTDKIINEVIKEHYEGKAFANIPTYKVNEFIKALYHTNSNKGVEIENNIALSSQPFWNEIKDKLILIYNEVCLRVEAAKRRFNTITQNDEIKYAARLLESETIRRAVAAELEYLFIDEMQDTNHDQYLLVNALISSGVKVLVAGDKKQSIYAFRGADLKSFNSMVNDLFLTNKNGADNNLDENFRTDKEIIEFFNTVFDSGFYFSGKRLNFDYTEIVPHKVGEPAEDKVALYHDMDLVKVIHSLTQGKFLPENIIKENETDFDMVLDTVWYNYNIGVLCRNNHELSIFSKMLQQANIPIRVIGGKSFYKSKAILDTFKIFNAVINSNSVEQSELKYTDYYNAFNRAYSETEDKRLSDLIRELRYDLRSNTIINFLNVLFEKTKIIEYYLACKNEQEAANLSKLKDICRNKYDEGMQPTDFLWFLDIMTASSPDEDAAVIKGETGITLTTIHRSKGLAFDTVIVPNIDNNINKKSLQKNLFYNAKTNVLAINKDELFTQRISEKITPDELYEAMIQDEVVKQLEEELRVYYVAFTRAKHKLVLGTDKSKSKLEYKMKINPAYLSMYKWLYEIDNGQLILKIEK